MTSINSNSPSAQARAAYENSGSNIDGQIRDYVVVIAESITPREERNQRVNQNQFETAFRGQLGPVMRDAEVAKQALQIAISDAQDQGDHQKVAVLRTELNELTEIMRSVQESRPDSRLAPSEFRAKWNEAIQELAGSVADALSIADTVVSEQSSVSNGKTSSSMDRLVEAGLGVYVPPKENLLQSILGGKTESTSSSDTESQSSTESVSESKSEAKSEAVESEGKNITDMGWGNEDYDAMMDQLQRDPAGLMAKLDELDPTSKNQALTLLQQRLQEVNRMFSMLSNMQKSIHDTMKAAINNMRV